MNGQGIFMEFSSPHLFVWSFISIGMDSWCGDRAGLLLGGVGFAHSPTLLFGSSVSLPSFPAVTEAVEVEFTRPDSRVAS
jgi:hypothetical protein